MMKRETKTPPVPAVPVFIYKTGFTNGVDSMLLKQVRKNSAIAKQSAGLRSHKTSKAKSICSHYSNTAWKRVVLMI